MSQPVLLAVESDAPTLSDVERELTDRYRRHYQVVCVSSPDDARTHLDEFAASGVDVAVVLAGQRLPGTTGIDLLGEVRHAHRHARRALLIEWGDWGQRPTGRAIFDGIAKGRLDHYVLRPAASPDELFHQTISGMLLDWAEASRAAPNTIHIVGDSWSGRSYELREALQQCAIPHTFCLLDSPEGRELTAGVGHVDEDLPLMIFPNGEVLRNPTNSEIALAAGAPVDPEREHFDLVVVGAGPAGLSAAVYGASEGLSTLVVDRGGIGGQATSSSLIRNYLGFPRGIAGHQLARSAYDQAWVFGAEFAFMHTVTSIEREGEDVVVGLSEGPRVRAAAVLLAMGASYRRLGVPSLEALVGAGVYYGGTMSEAPAVSGCNVVVVGGANSAGQAVLHLARYAGKVTLVVRGSSLDAGMSEYLVSQVEATDNIEVRLGTKVIGGGGEGRLERVVVSDVDGRSEETLDASALFLLIGAEPYTEWLPSSVERDAQGFVLTGADISPGRWTLDRPPFALETSLPGVFAGGDTRHGSVKRVASAVGEGSIAVQLVHRLFAAEGRVRRGHRAVDATGVA